MIKIIPLSLCSGKGQASIWSLIKDASFLNLGFLSNNATHFVQESPGLVHIILWKVSQETNRKTDTLATTMAISKKVLYLWSRSLLSSPNIQDWLFTGKTLYSSWHLHSTNINHLNQVIKVKITSNRTYSLDASLPTTKMFY